MSWERKAKHYASRAVTELLEYGFDAFDAGEVLSGQGGVAQARVYGGRDRPSLVKTDITRICCCTSGSFG